MIAAILALFRSTHIILYVTKIEYIIYNVQNYSVFIAKLFTRLATYSHVGNTCIWQHHFTKREFVPQKAIFLSGFGIVLTVWYFFYFSFYCFRQLSCITLMMHGRE